MTVTREARYRRGVQGGEPRSPEAWNP